MTDPVVPTPAPAPVPAGAVDPGRTLGIVGLILAFVAAPVGIVVSAIARSQSKKAGFKNGLATAGIIIGIIVTLLYIAIPIISSVILLSQCASLGAGTYGSLTCG